VVVEGACLSMVIVGLAKCGWNKGKEDEMGGGGRHIYLSLYIYTYLSPPICACRRVQAERANAGLSVEDATGWGCMGTLKRQRT
jgi:hypothetical protein